MTTGRSNTPSWMPHLIGALLTAGTVWMSIRTEVPTMVQEAVQVEVNAMSTRMVLRQDSAWQAAQVQLHERIGQEASAVRDSLQATLNLVRTDHGRITYAPNITVEADTSGIKAITAMAAKLDSIMDLNMRLLQRTQGLERDKKGRLTWRQ